MKNINIVKKVVGILLIGGMVGTSLYARCDANAKKLIRSYPNFLKSCENNYIIWKDGTKMLYDDGKRKNFNQKLNNPDIEDMFAYRYPRGSSSFAPPSYNYDPGRIRYEPLFRKMYGNSAGAVRRHLTSINWFGHRIRVTRVNNVAGRLQAVEHELEKLPPSYRKYLTPIGGTFMWRKIAGTNRLSVHSFGAAIDINVKHSAYWRWTKGKYRNEIPPKIVEIFERHGFIWGGKWYHFDTMHFEYRPELL